MQNNDYAGLSRTFDTYFPGVKTLVKQTEQFHNKQFEQAENASFGMSMPTLNLEIARQIGLFELNTKDVECILPRLFFKKTDDRTNPYFYVITTPDNGILFFGSSIEDAKPKSIVASVSALTGGLVPVLETKQMYIVYLGLLSAIKKYGYCKVYELKTGYENIKLIDVKGKQIPLRTKSEYLAPALSHQLMESLEAIPIINQFTAQFMDDSQKVRDEEIWSAVSTFKGMIKNGLIGKEEKKPKKTKKHTIKVKQEDDRLTFFFDDEVELYSYDEFKDAMDEKMEKLVPTSAKILCQTGETVYDKYTSYIAKKVNETPKKKPTRNVEEMGEFLYYFENMSANFFGHDIKIRYFNIHFIGMPTDKHSKFYDGFSLGTLKYEEPHIVIKNAKDITLEHIKKTAVILENLFELDPEETDVILL